MRRNPIKLGILLGGLAVASLPGLPARAQNPTVAPIGTNVPPADVRARMWAATARFVYADDPALVSLRPQLRQTIDSSSVKAFGRHLEDAVKLESKNLPKLEHVLKFQGDFKTISARNEQPDVLATSIANRLRDNKPERQNKPAFVQLRNTLHALADPNAPVAAPAPEVATSPAGTDTVAEPASQAGTAIVQAPAKDFTIINSPPNPMLTYIALALSVISLLVSLLKGNSKKRHRHHDSAAASGLATLTDEMRAEVRTIVQREVSNKVPGARPAPAPATKPQAATPAPAAATKPAPAAAAKADPVQPTPAQPAPPQPQAPMVAPVAAPAAAEPLATTSAEDEDLFDIKYPADNELANTPAAAPPTRTLYANQQPIDGIFQRNMLAEAPASYTIFELTTAADAPDQARFVVTGNQAGHAGFIGSHVNILGGACEYPFPKGSVSRIVTDAPGVAQRTANGDWQISQKAQIHFE